MIIPPLDTSDIEWSQFDGDIYPSMLVSTLNPKKRNISETIGGHNHTNFNPRFEGIRKPKENYLGSEAYLNAVSQRGFIDRTRVLLHRAIGKK